MCVLYKSGVYVLKVTMLTPGDLLDRPAWAGLGEGRPKPNGKQESAEGIVGKAGKASEALQGRKVEQRIGRAAKP